jgi:hypothetical protein
VNKEIPATTFRDLRRLRIIGGLLGKLDYLLRVLSASAITAT